MKKKSQVLWGKPQSRLSQVRVRVESRTQPAQELYKADGRGRRGSRGKANEMRLEGGSLFPQTTAFREQDRAQVHKKL